ncbi:hypothetical protein FKM82_006462 [Ascaphus truei]
MPPATWSSATSCRNLLPFPCCSRGKRGNCGPGARGGTLLHKNEGKSLEVKTDLAATARSRKAQQYHPWLIQPLNPESHTSP